MRDELVGIPKKNNKNTVGDKDFFVFIYCIPPQEANHSFLQFSFNIGYHIMAGNKNTDI